MINLLTVQGVEFEVKCMQDSQMPPNSFGSGSQQLLVGAWAASLSLAALSLI
eukprot:CAMPEP_0168611072 /NCGR_PEP_ID=MMETSP0449_2-20121227/2149_1 /TAXON_ID=1082188 /ORGANISM="Strombidium rassoulzadegani, Strain ras09" /LENGTH=51 /DNA_ID=CAMNT_0008651467 /DNA_START=716 /DNA_END=871 /DNA_ORIENTATION=+